MALTAAKREQEARNIMSIDSFLIRCICFVDIQMWGVTTVTVKWDQWCDASDSRLALGKTLDPAGHRVEIQKGAEGMAQMIPVLQFNVKFELNSPGWEYIEDTNICWLFIETVLLIPVKYLLPTCCFHGPLIGSDKGEQLLHFKKLSNYLDFPEPPKTKEAGTSLGPTWRPMAWWSEL